MTDAAAPTRHPVITVVARIPATLITLGLVLVAGLVSAALWFPLRENHAWRYLAYGLPSLLEGHWWTPLTGALLVHSPILYPVVIVSFAGMAYLEFHRGWKVATRYFVIGQIGTVLVAALIVWLLAMTGWPWAVAQSHHLDVGPSGGTMACIAAAVGLFRPPWRVRAWLVLLAFVGVTMVFWGNLGDLEHAVSVIGVLIVDRSLRLRKASLREKRFIAFVAVLALGALEIIVLVVPTAGMFGSTTPDPGPILDVTVDVVVIVLIARGLLRGRRWTWWVAAVFAGGNILAVVFVLIGAELVGWSEVTDAISGDPALTIVSGVLWALLLVYLLIERRAFRAGRGTRLSALPPPTRAEVRRALHRDGGGTLSWMATWDANSTVRTATGGMLTYQRRNGVALALGDPFGPPSDAPGVVDAFVDGAEHAGLVPCFFSASESTRALLPPSWRSLVVAADTIVDLPGLQFTGKKWNSVRTSLNRADREQVEFRMTHLVHESWGVRQQIRAISEEWLGDKDLPEMGFTLGSLIEAADPEVRIALAVTPSGDVDGFLSWLPVYGAQGVVRGWTLDLMRRREGGFPSVMEFLIGSSAQQFEAEGAEFMSLSGAPLAHDLPQEAGGLAALGDRLAESLEPVYGFRSLQRFKQKFHPRHEPLYLLYRDESDLTRIGLALVRAFLPTATLRQLAAAGVDVVRAG
ncbi:MAG: DUF2156 domain-containing protein [Microbacterium ginsengisoli]|jgi:phosphatidylglycerol lysyltransferase|uniref:bifunctional lysylphosphatidylglycerol flippase/synthetase MprF n=2 Tax=Microbacteriaceae TaxID=85023 RepID=UPI0006F76864|nr:MULTISPECIES: DUF2156 domain-containing protein [unclassified Microbacterium]KQR92104.1 hypothetical protein ASF93_05750 [Microbacterium sp. Leaf347]MBN9197715.1 DUF2156 domain-containing protein [Microbacterium ginsengisoli]OJU79365.1 MAG: hypothetical protein BGO15_10685 [Microbacterium sp. 71-23]